MMSRVYKIIYTAGKYLPHPTQFINISIALREKITPRGIRIPVASVKGKCPRPLDDGSVTFV